EAVLCMAEVSCILSGQADAPTAALPDTVRLGLARRAGQRGAWVWRVPAGWRAVEAAGGEHHQDRDGSDWLAWTQDSARIVLVRAAAAASPPPRVSPMVAPDARAQDASALVRGPSPQI